MRGLSSSLSEVPLYNITRSDLAHLHPWTEVSEVTSDYVQEDSHVSGVKHARGHPVTKYIQQELGHGVRTTGFCYGNRILCWSVHDCGVN